MGYAAYIKISKIDKNGVNQTNVLQSLNQLTIPYSTSNIAYKILEITEHPTYFLYYINPAGIVIGDKAEIKYDFTGSTLLTSDTFQGVTDMTGAPDLFRKIPIISTSTDSLGFFHTGSSTNTNNINPLNTYRLSTYPQETLLIEFSGSIMLTPGGSGFGTVGVGLAYIEENSTEPKFSWRTSQGNSKATFQVAPHATNSVTASFHISASISASVFNPFDAIYPTYETYIDSGYTNVTASFTSDTIFKISSPPATGLQVGLIAEPYFGSNDFLRALDCQPLLNNANTNRIHNLYQDVDYSAGATEPVNFDLLINGSATRAEVQLSNYTTQRHILPRYDGSKSTSKELNRWTPGDSGTFGKTPTIESLKTVVAYCDFIGGWPPERMNASTAHILYLIDVDGNISIPNTSENSLANVQGAFQTGERFKISSETFGGGVATPFRTVIRGGQRIEPILYTQIGHSPAAWTASIHLENKDFTSDQSSIDNYQATHIPSADGNVTTTFSTANFTEEISAGSGGNWVSNAYKVTADLIEEGVNLNINLINEYRIAQIIDSNVTIITQIIKSRGGVITVLDEINNSNNLENSYTTFNNHNISITTSELQTNDQIYLRHRFTSSGGALVVTHKRGGSYFIVTQTPSPTSLIVTSTGVNTLWNYPDNTNSLNVISCSNDVLTTQYGNTFIKQQNASASGFNNVALPWSIEIGDEFRFEGREDLSYMVKRVYIPGEISSDRTGSINSLEIHFNGNLPSESIDLDHFVIRRYVDDASSVLMEGFKPENSTGPFIITPEYVAPKMNKKVDEYITLLTEKGLL